MPITIVQPSGGTTGSGPNAVIEVGHLIRAQTDFIGPLSDQAVWSTEVWLNAAPEFFVMRRKYPFTTNTLNVFAWQSGVNDAAKDGEGFGVRPTAVSPATLRVMLDDPTSSFHEQAQVPVQLTAPFNVENRIGGQSTITESFTDQDRARLQIVEESVQVPLPISTALGAVAKTALGAFVTSAPLGLLTRQECQQLVGAGSLTRPSPLYQVNAMGFTFDFVTVPPFFGRKAGSLTEYEQRIVQFRVIQRDLAGADHTIQLIDAQSDNQAITWGLNAPIRVEYSVTEGCAVQFCWLLLLGAPSP